MSSSNNSQNASSDDPPSERNIDDGLTPSGNGITSGSTSSSLRDTRNHYNQNTSNSNAQAANSAGGSTAAASNNAANNPPVRHRWSQTVGTAIFSYDPVTRQLVPIGGTAPVTTWQTTNPLAGNNGSAPGSGDTGAGRNPATGADPPAEESLFPEEGASMSTHLSFSTPDGRPIPISVMRQLLAGMPGTLPASMNELLNQNAAANPNQQLPQSQTFQAPPQTRQAFRQWQQAAPPGDQFPDMDTADGIPRSLLGQPPPQRARTSSEPLFPSAAPVPNTLPPSPSFGVAFLPVSALHTQHGLHHHHHHHHHPTYWNPNLTPTAVPTAANDGLPAAPVSQAGNQQNQNPDGQPTGDEPGRSAFVTLWDPIRGRMFTTTTPMPEMGTQAPVTGHGVGWTVPVAGPDGNMTTRFVGWGAGTVHGLGIPGLDPERPPDTRRAKELLRGLNLVPRGLVRRMERVEKMLGQEGAEGGRLVCAVCYDPLLGPVQPAVPLHTEDETDVAMDGHAPPSAGIDTDSDSKPKSSQEISEDSTAKAKQKAKPKHPSLDPNALIALPCTHVFHAVDCLLPWFEQGKTTCPTCRFDVDPHSETLNIGRWLGGAARRRRAAANTASGSTTGTPNSNTEPATSAAGAAVPMDAEEEDDETDAFAVEDEGVPGDLDPNHLFREAIGRAVATALTQALMNQTPPQHQMTLPPGALPTSASPTTSDAVMADGVFGPIRSEPPASQSEWARRFDATVVDHLGLMGRMDSLNPSIELPGANRDQDGRMFRDDGESSVAATADSSSESDNSDDLLAREQVEFGPPRRARAQAPSPSPPLAVNPEASGGRMLRSSSRLNGTSSATTSDRSTALDRFRDDLMALDTPNAGPSNSGQAASSASRPPTPFRHHPYANARPAPNFNPRPTPIATTQVPAQNAPGPNGTPAEYTPAPAGAHTGPPVLIGPHGEMIYQRPDGSGRVSITRHSITFNLALPPAEQLTQPTTADPADLTGNNRPQQQQPQQQRADAANRIPEFLSNVFTRTGIFGPPPPGATGTANGNRTERPPPRPRRKWVAPEGTSLRSVIESKERQVGLRCDDVSCLWAPEDGDDETMEVTIHPDRTYLRKTASDGLASCTHRYHPECLLVASRVAEAGLDREIDAVGDGEWLEVACPFCRVHGGQEKSEWRMYRDLADSAQ